MCKFLTQNVIKYLILVDGFALPNSQPFPCVRDDAVSSQFPHHLFPMFLQQFRCLECTHPLQSDLVPIAESIPTNLQLKFINLSSMKWRDGDQTYQFLGKLLVHNGRDSHIQNRTLNRMQIDSIWRVWARFCVNLAISKFLRKLHEETPFFQQPKGIENFM